jgi:hypothetical protein
MTIQAEYKKIIFLILFISTFFVARLHFYRFPLSGEEGIFAELLVNQPENPQILLSGRADGSNVYIQTRHPIALYNSIKGCGKLFGGYLAKADWTNDAEITPRLRFVFSLFQFVILMTIAIFVVSKPGWPKYSLLYLLFAVAVSPVGLATSTNLQVDGSIGAAMTGLVGLALLLVLRNGRLNLINGIVLFVTTFFLATGKQEWSIIFVAALLISICYLLFLRSHDKQSIRNDITLIVIIFTALIAGNIYSYFLSPYAYTESFWVMRYFSGADELVSGNVTAQRMLWMKRIIAKLPWMCTSSALAVIFAVLSFYKRKWPKPVEFLLVVFGCGLLGGYFIANNSSEPRYFAPSLMILTIATIAIFPQTLSRRYVVIISVITMLMFASTGIFYYNNTIKKPVKPYFDASTVKLEAGEAAIISTGSAWNKKGLDFVNYDAGKAWAKTYAERYNKKLYPQDITWSSSDIVLEKRNLK